MRRILAFSVSLLLSAAACQRDSQSASQPGSETWAPARLKSVKGVPAAQIEAALKQQLARSRPAQLDEDQWKHVNRLYRAYGQNPLWLTADGLHNQRATALVNAILLGDDDAFRMDRYPVGELARAIVAVRGGQQSTAEQLARVDVLLTSAFVALGEDMLTGQVNPKEFAQSWHIDTEEENVDSALTRALRNPALDKSIATMRPQTNEYRALQRELVRFRRIVAAGGWPRIPEGKGVKPGETDNPARLAALRARLRAEGLLPADPQAAAQPQRAPSDAQAQAGERSAASPAQRGPASSNVYDAALAGAVAAYQARHGIVVDSALGPETVESLNVPAAYRMAQIAANLERLRWLPRDFGSRYLIVNVPAFRLEAFDGGRKTLEMKVIVGAEYEDRATPVFSDSMEFVVFRPYWNVTDDIATKELWPKINSDPGYMARNNYEIWHEGGKARIRQKPGAKNSLGLVKFMFPNDFNIYLHDTPDDDLFKEDVRAFSHGCIRLEKPEQLAQWVLGWPAERVQQYMYSGSDNRTVQLPRRLPVFIAYTTTYVRDGQLYFGNDLYDRDDKLVNSAFKAAAPTPEVMQAVQALRRIAASA